MLADFSISSFMASFIFSVIGLWLFKEGRRQAEIRLALIGVSLMGYSYFTSSPAADWGIGFLLCGLAYLIWNNLL